MLQFFFFVDFIAFREVFDDIDIQTVFHNEAALPRGFGIFASFINRLQHREIVFAAALIVVFTEGRRGVYDAGTVFCGNIVHAGNDERVFIFVRYAERHQLLIFPVFHVAALELLEHFVFVAREHLGCQTFRDIEDIALVVSGGHAHLDVVDIRPDRQRDIGCQRPRGRRPREKIFVVRTLFLEFTGQGVDFNHLIPLRDLMGGQTGSAARAVRQDLVALVDQSHIEGFFEDPPAGFDIVVVQRDIRVIHVSHICHAVGHLRPHIRVGKNRFAAFFVEFLDAVSFDILLAGESELFFHFDLDRKAMGIPAALSLYLIALHGLVAVDGILERSCHHVVDARLAVRCRRSFIEYKGRRALARGDAFVQQVFFLPFRDLFLLHFCNRFF